ncbi:MAG: tripartite tricarboxylate transporter substrate binding protein BugD [Alphaproteobacteria bacterium]|nr:MAG: tripartite tricarboxylate transporter substrate binding protein BugD [Alphaproteobacteria bacterium]
MVAAVVGAAVGVAPTSLSAQGFPTRPITLVVPFAAGGPTDVLGRIVSRRMASHLGQPVVVENVGGAGGAIGAQRVQRAAPDGYTLVLGNIGTHTAVPALAQPAPYDPETDFQPVGLIATNPLVLVVRPGLATDVAGLVRYLKTPGTRATYASAGVGASSHLGGLLFLTQTGTMADHIPYRGTAPALADVAAGRVDFLFDQTVNVIGQVAGGTVTALGVSTRTRAAVLPDVPSLMEAGVPGFDTAVWNALFAPRGTPTAVVERLAEALSQALEDPAVRDRLVELGGELPTPAARGPAALAALVAAEVVRWTPILRAAASGG